MREIKALSVGFDLESPFLHSHSAPQSGTFPQGQSKKKRQRRPSFDKTGMKTQPAVKMKREMSRNVAF